MTQSSGGFDCRLLQASIQYLQKSNNCVLARRGAEDAKAFINTLGVSVLKFLVMRIQHKNNYNIEMLKHCSALRVYNGVCISLRFFRTNKSNPESQR